MKLTKVGVLSAGKVFGFLYGLLGLIFGGFASLFSLLAATSDTGAAGLLFGAGAIFLLPILYGIFGFLFGMIIAALYNLTANFTGGIEIEVS